MASSQPDELLACTVCDATACMDGRDLRRCSRCKVARYCGQDCQKGWPKHGRAGAVLARSATAQCAVASGKALMLHAGLAQPHIDGTTATEDGRDKLAASFADLPDIPAECFGANGPDVLDVKLARMWDVPLRLMLVVAPPLNLSAYAGLVQPLRSCIWEVDRKKRRVAALSYGQNYFHGSRYRCRDLW